MYIDDQNMKLPSDPSTIVWKYLDLSKFVDLLLYQKLFMPRSDKFEDQYEGTFSKSTFEAIGKLSLDNSYFSDYCKIRGKYLVPIVGTLTSKSIFLCGKYSLKKR